MQHGCSSPYVAQYGHTGKASSKASKTFLQKPADVIVPRTLFRSSETFDTDYVFRPEILVMADTAGLILIGWNNQQLLHPFNSKPTKREGPSHGHTWLKKCERLYWDPRNVEEVTWA